MTRWQFKTTGDSLLGLYGSLATHVLVILGLLVTKPSIAVPNPMSSPESQTSRTTELDTEQMVGPESTDIIVTAVGRWPVGQTPRPLARQQALRIAYANALEQGAGVHVRRRTDVFDYRRVVTSMTGECSGYISRYVITTDSLETRTGEWVVELQATVKPESKAAPDVEAIRLCNQAILGGPSVLVVVCMIPPGNPAEVSQVGRRVAEAMQDLGFQTQPRPYKSSCRSLDELADAVRGTTPGENEGSALAFLGAVKTEEFDPSRDPRFSDLRTCLASLEFALIDLTTDETVYSGIKNAKGNGLTAGQANQQAISRAIGSTVEHLNQGLVDAVARIRRSVVLTLRNVTLEDMQLFVDSVNAVIPEAAARREIWIAETREAKIRMEAFAFNGDVSLLLDSICSRRPEFSVRSCTGNLVVIEKR